jgi:Xaa-Pro dipeptidase
VEISVIQQAIREAGLDGWLFYDFHNRDLTAYRILGLDPAKHAMRRWFYWVPAAGEPIRLVHGVEATKLDPLSGRKVVYVTWQRLHEALGEILGGSKKIAMQYSPEADIPYVSLVDAGTVELVRNKGGVEIVTSADLVSRFEAVFGPEGLASHRRAMVKTHQIKDEAFARIAAALEKKEKLTEFELARFIIDRFEQEEMTMDDSVPIVGADGHPADPHFEPTAENSVPFAPGQCILIDLWGRELVPEAIYADITWCGFSGAKPPAEYLKIWQVVCDARDAACELAIERFAKGEPVFGYEVDRRSRDVIDQSGYGEFFLHRTGHSIGHEVHGNGANIDDFETRDSRRILPGTSFSIEPGIYLADRMAVRTEVDMIVTAEGQAEVSGPVQKDLILLT